MIRFRIQMFIKRENVFLITHFCQNLLSLALEFGRIS